MAVSVIPLHAWSWIFPSTICLKTSQVGEKGYDFGRLLSGILNGMFLALHSPQPITKPRGKSMERITGHDFKMAIPVERLLILCLTKCHNMTIKTYKYWVYLIYCIPMKVIRLDIFQESILPVIFIRILKYIYM
jgi:hypothetical protein